MAICCENVVLGPRGALLLPSVAMAKKVFSRNYVVIIPKMVNPCFEVELDNSGIMGIILELRPHNSGIMAS
jgi:hypothetical protein